MTVTATYDNTNAKVTLRVDQLRAIDAVLIERSINNVVWNTVRGAVAATPAMVAGSFADTFSRTVSNNWSPAPADTGQSWVVTAGAAAQFSVGTGTGKVSVNALNTNFAVTVDLTSSDQDLTYFVTMPALITGVGGAAIVDLRAREVDSSNNYALRLTFNTSGTITAAIMRTLAGAGSTLVSLPSLTLVAGHTYGMRLQVIGQNLAAKAWDATAGSEPAAFQASVNNAELQVGNSSSVLSFLNSSVTNALPYIFSYDNFTGSLPVLTLDDYEFTPGVLNTYRLTAVPPGLYLPGVVNMNATTPDAAALDVAGDIDLRVDATLADWTPAAVVSLVAKVTTTTAPANQRSYWLRVETDGKLALFWSIDGVAFLSATSTVSVPLAGAGRLAVRATLDVDNGAAGRTATFYTAATMAGPWVQLGAAVTTGGTTSIFVGTAPLEVGTVNGGAGSPLMGVVHSVQVLNLINGVPVANPDFTLQANLATSFADPAGRTWTVNGAQAQIFTVQTVTVTPNLDRVWLKSLVRPFLNRAVLVVRFTDPGRPARSSEFDVVSRTLPVGVNDLRSSRRWTIDVYVANAADAQTFDYILAAGDVMLLQVPNGCEMPGGYVAIKDTGQRHPEGRVHGNSRVFTLPLVEVAAPGPDVAANIGTWQSVLAQYATWNAVLAAFPTWNDLLALHGVPSEVIVP